MDMGAGEEAGAAGAVWRFCSRSCTGCRWGDRKAAATGAGCRWGGRKATTWGWGAGGVAAKRQRRGWGEGNQKAGECLGHGPQQRARVGRRARASCTWA